jgi:hypothetical protein
MRIGGESPGYELVPVEPQKTSPEAPHGERSSAFSKALRGVGRAIDGGEALIARAARGNLGGLDSAQLIALQAGIYRYSEAIDLVGKLVDRATSAVKTVVSPH